jgi:hypothetical protein
MPKRLNIRVSDADDKLVREYSVKWGVNLSQMGSICVHIGIKALMRVVAPEDAFSPAKWAEIAVEANKLGYDMKKEGENG